MPRREAPRQGQSPWRRRSTRRSRSASWSSWPSDRTSRRPRGDREAARRARGDGGSAASPRRSRPWRAPSRRSPAPSSRAGRGGCASSSRIRRRGAAELEAGIEIELRPAGKRITRLSLLSGGEKALGAISFLFALFLAKPCPFYLLDEVEAALDDANVIRFVELLRRYSDRAQFIVITHQKRTMEAADVLYGVTMGGDGVSRDRVAPAAAARPGRCPRVVRRLTTLDRKASS